MSYLAKKDYDKIMIDKSLKKLGLFMPMLSLTVAVLFVIYKKDNFSCLIIFYILNLMLNQTLKHWIKEPRPIDANHNAVIKSDSYGMPSGHAQMAAFVTTFFLLYAKEYKYVFGTIFTAITFATLYQRYKYRAHSLFQIVVGALIGIFMGFTSSYFEIA